MDLIELHLTDGADKGPLHLISAELLAHYRACAARLAEIEECQRRARAARREDED